MPRLKAAPVKRTSDRFHPDSEIVQNDFNLHDVDDDDDDNDAAAADAGECPTRWNSPVIVVGC